ncbi:MAG TPA: T9SS type A sorting domain-containing protein, partial [Saprospiraceae bacterium]|nr:T9SS type A sorting domain-containing protein [Saprospiraceae bacterium]
PLELISFTGRKNGDENVLSFMTTKGKNVTGFDIQRSEDGRNFGTIGTLAISTACEALCKYGYVDRQPVKGFNYYRIKILDKDNSYAYSNIVSILNGGQTEFLLSPNPVSDYISIPEDALLSKFTLLNANGQFIKGGKIETYKLNVSDLPGGFYFLIIESKDINNRYRFVKM